MIPKQKELVEEVKVEWKMLWHERLDDKLRAEGIAIRNYNNLFVDKGTIIHATRDFKALNLRDILEQHQIQDVERYIPPNPYVGGWTKFVRDKITNNSRKKNRADNYPCAPKEKQHLKQNGRGWLHK
jgi:hypothetical protein